VGKRVGKPGPAAHLQQHLGERDACGEHAGCGRAQRAELLGLLQRLETCQVGAVCAGELGDLQRDVLGQALGGLPVGAVELDADPLERLPRIGLKIEPGADVHPRGRPSGPAEQLSARIGEPSGACHEHVAPLKGRD
jgi:hypothetical protein